MFKSLNRIKHIQTPVNLSSQDLTPKKARIIHILQNEKLEALQVEVTFPASGMTCSPGFRLPPMLLAAGMGTEPRTFLLLRHKSCLLELHGNIPLLLVVVWFLSSRGLQLLREVRDTKVTARDCGKNTFHFKQCFEQVKRNRNHRQYKSTKGKVQIKLIGQNK